MVRKKQCWCVKAGRRLVVEGNTMYCIVIKQVPLKEPLNYYKFKMLSLRPSAMDGSTPKLTKEIFYCSNRNTLSTV